MNAADWIIVGVLGLSTLLAAAEGFFYEAFSLAGAVVGFVLAVWEYWRVASLFLPYVKSQATADACGFFTVFFAVVLLASMIGKLARWALRKVGLSWADRFLGAAFGLVRGVIVVTVSIMALTAFVPESKLLAQSRLSRYFFLSAKAVAVVAPADLRERVKQGVMALRKPAVDGHAVK